MRRSRRVVGRLIGFELADARRQVADLLGLLVKQFFPARAPSRLSFCATAGVT
jgi:hypothetical protein